MVCHAPRSTRSGVPEYSSHTEFVLSRRGVLAVHRGGEMAAATTVLVLADEEIPGRASADGGDTCTVLAFAPEIAQEALAGRPARHGILARLQLRRRWHHLAAKRADAAAPALTPV